VAVKKVLRGQNVMLRPMVDQDLVQRAHWMTDQEILQTMGMPADLAMRPLTYQQAVAECHRWFKNATDNGDYIWAIDVDGIIIGDITCHIYEPEHKGELYIVIGDKAMWGKGFGKDACAMVLDEVFREFEIYFVDTFVIPGNTRSFSLALSLGFTPFGTQTGGTKVLRLIKKSWLARAKQRTFIG
jgi:RimJ/RimL family protein N-acetyltransferase